MVKLIICYIGQDVEEFIGMSLDSIKDVADHIVFVDGGSKDGTLGILHNNYDFVESKDPFKFPENWNEKSNIVFYRKYEQDHVGANGRARNAYLKFIQENFEGDWCLVLDPDEVVENAMHIKTWCEQLEKQNWKQKDIIGNPKMRHFQQDLGHEDATRPEHFCLGRLFKISKDLFYDEVEHPVLQSKATNIRVNVMGFTIWHLAYCKQMFEMRDKYLNHLEKSNIHSKEFLRDWYLSHLLGTYPKREIDPLTLPKQIRKEFLIDEDDEFYFKNRKRLEMKHVLMVKQWQEYFKPKTVLDCGCGAGQYSYVWDWFCDVQGFDLSNYIITHTPFKHLKLFVGSIVDFNKIGEYDLVTAIDVLEHLEYDDLDKALENLYKWSKKDVLFSIPFKGDSNLDADKTHIIKEEKQWWIEKIAEAGFIVEGVPPEWFFSHQLLIGRKK